MPHGLMRLDAMGTIGTDLEEGAGWLQSDGKRRSGARNTRGGRWSASNRRTRGPLVENPQSEQRLARSP